MSELFNKLAAQEQGLYDSQFLCPVAGDSIIRVEISGVIMSLKVTSPARFNGWGIFQPTNSREARFVRKPTLKERQAYLARFPRLRFVVSHKRKRRWFGVPLHAGCQVKADNFAAIELAEGLNKFETVIVRFDGQRCWFDQRDPCRNLRIATAFRTALAEDRPIESLDVPESNQVERQVYASALKHKWLNAKEPDQSRIESALRRGGAKYHSHREIGDCFTVIYEVNGETHQSTIDKATLTVQAAGFCLDGFDANFDLQSLVGVIEEGQRTSQINRF